MPSNKPDKRPHGSDGNYFRKFGHPKGGTYKRRHENKPGMVTKYGVIARASRYEKGATELTRYVDENPSESKIKEAVFRFDQILPRDKSKYRSYKKRVEDLKRALEEAVAFRNHYQRKVEIMSNHRKRLSARLEHILEERKAKKLGYYRYNGLSPEERDELYQRIVFSTQAALDPKYHGTDPLESDLEVEQYDMPADMSIEERDAILDTTTLIAKTRKNPASRETRTEWARKNYQRKKIEKKFNE